MPNIIGLCGSLQIPSAAKVFDDQGQLRDQAVRARLEEFVTGFSAFVAERRR